MAVSDPFTPPVSPIAFRDATAPGAQADIDRVLTPDADKPTMAATAPDEVDLPAGIMLISGHVATTARVRELTGRDEEDLARASAPERLISALLSAGVVAVGDAPMVTSEILDSMLVGDRDALILGIRRATFGGVVEFERYSCSACAQSFALSVDLDDVPIVKLDEPGKLTFEVSLRGGRTARVRHATGTMQADLMRVARERKLTVPEQDTYILSRAVLAIDSGDGVWRDMSTNTAHAQALSLADRRAIMRAMSKSRPGPRMDEVKVTCPDCGSVEEIGLTVDALFRG